MGWYRVTKTIHGRQYDYWQRTYRVGKSVKTENRYIGPSSARHVVPVHPNSPGKHDQHQAQHYTQTDVVLVHPSSLPQPSPSRVREAVMSNFDRYAGMSKDFRKLVKRFDNKQRRKRRTRAEIEADEARMNGHA